MPSYFGSCTEKASDATSRSRSTRVQPRLRNRFCRSPNRLCWSWQQIDRLPSQLGRKNDVRGSWTEIAGAFIVGLSGLAGALRGPWWTVVGFALLLSLLRWEMIVARAREVRNERNSSGLPWLAEAYGAVL